MRASLPALLALALSGPSPADEKPPEKYESAAGGYRVRFPGAPTVEVAAATDGKPARNTAMFEAAKGPELYAVGVLEFPAGKQDADRTFRLDDDVERCVDGWRMKVIAVKKFEFGQGKLAARDVRAAAADGKLVSRSLFILDADKRRLYLVSVHSGRDVATGTFADAFLGSFELLPKK